MVVTFKFACIFSNPWGRMISASNGLQPHGIWTQKDKYIQLILFFFQKCLLLFSDLYPTFFLFNCNQMNILFLSLWKFDWFHHRTIVIKILSLDFFIDISVIKPIPMMIKIHEYLFCNNKRYYCSGSSPESTFMYTFFK